MDCSNWRKGFEIGGLKLTVSLRIEYAKLYKGGSPKLSELWVVWLG